MIVESVNSSIVAKNMQDVSRSGNQVAYLILLPSYAMILFYAVKGHKYRKWSS